MSDREWFKELGSRDVGLDEDEEKTRRQQEEDEDGKISYIVETMDRDEELAHADDDRGRRVKLHKRRDGLRWLLREASRVRREVKSDYLRRNSLEGSEWRPHRHLKRNIEPDEPEVPFDYRDDVGVGLEDWDKWWRETWGRVQFDWQEPRGRPRRFFIEEGLADGEEWTAGNKRTRYQDTRIPKDPLVVIYFLVNEWYQCVLGKKFWPDFTSALVVADHDRERLRHLGPAARLFYLVANAVDREYTMDLCKKVHDDYYGKLPKRIE